MPYAYAKNKIGEQDALGNQNDGNCRNGKDDTKCLSIKIHGELKIKIYLLGGYPWDGQLWGGRPYDIDLIMCDIKMIFLDFTINGIILVIHTILVILIPFCSGALKWPIQFTYTKTSV
jgi:hypothetical protein